MAKAFDTQVLDTMVMSVLVDTFKKMLNVDFSGQPVVTEKDIIEYNGRMRIFPMEKFNGPVYVAAINYYLSQKDMESGFAIGTFVLFVKESVAEKLFRAFGRSIKDAEDEALVLDVVGEFCNILAGNVKNEFVSLGYADLFISAPLKYKNDVPEGLQFDYSLFKKQEVVISPWNQKCMVVEVCMGNVPMKAK